MVAREEIIWLAATIALGATLAAGDCTESIGVRRGLPTGPELSGLSDRNVMPDNDLVLYIR